MSIQSVVQTVLTNLYNHGWNPAAATKQRSGSFILNTGGLYINWDMAINWASYDVNTSVNMATPGTSNLQNGLTSINNHDVQTCLQYLHAVALWKKAFPTSTIFDNPNSNGYMGLSDMVNHIITDFAPATNSSNGGYNNPKGWIYFQLLDIYLLLQNSPLLTTTQVTNLRNSVIYQSFTYMNSWLDTTIHMFQNTKHVNYQPSQSLLMSAAVLDASIRWPSLITTGMFYDASPYSPQDATHWQSEALLSASNILSRGAFTNSYGLHYGVMAVNDSGGTDTISNPVVKSDDVSESAEAMVLLYNLTHTSSWLTNAASLLGNIDTYMLDNTNGGYYSSINVSSGSVNSAYKETRATAHMLYAYHLYNLATYNASTRAKEQSAINPLITAGQFYKTSGGTGGFLYRTDSTGSFGIMHDSYTPAFSTTLAHSVSIGDTSVQVNALPVHASSQCGTNIPSAGTYTCIPDDMTGIVNGVSIFVTDSHAETVTASNVVADVSFDATFANTHTSLPWTFGVSLLDTDCILNYGGGDEEVIDLHMQGVTGAGPYTIPVNSLANGGTGQFLKNHANGEAIQSMLYPIDLTEDEWTTEAMGNISVYLLQTLVTPLLPLGLSALIGGAGGTSVLIKDKTPSIPQAVNQRSTLSLTVEDASGSADYTYGTPITVSDSTNGTLFTGFISQADRNLLVGQTQKEIDIICMDNRYVADKKRVRQDYSNLDAGDIAVSIVDSYLVPEGVTGGYAYRRDTTASDWNQGTLSGTTGANNIGDGDLELARAGTTVTKLFNSTVDWNTGTLTSIDAGGGTIHIKGYSAIKFMATNAGNLGNSFVYWKIYNDGSTVVASGDNITYDVWISSTSPQIQAAVDITFTDGTTMRDYGGQSIKDQNGIHAHPGSDLTGFANDQWYHRFLDLTPVAGKTVQFVTVAFEGDNGGDYTAYFRSIKLNNSLNAVRVAYFDSTSNVYTPGNISIPQNYAVGDNGYSAISVTPVTVYDQTGTWISPAISIDAVKLVQSSLVTWVSVIPDGTTAASSNVGNNSPQVPTGTDIAVYTSVDAQATWQLATYNSSVPDLWAGFNVAGRSMYIKIVFSIMTTNPETSAIVDSVQSTVTSSWTQTKTDSITKYSSSGDFGGGNYTGTGYFTATNYSLYFPTNDNGVALSGYYDGFDALSGGLNYTAVWGTGTPTAYTKSRQLGLQCGGSTNDVRLELPDAGYTNFSTQVTFYFNDATKENGGGLCYRTTGWQNANDTYAYTAMLITNTGHGSTPNAGNTTLQLGRGTNTGSGGGAYTSISLVTMPFTGVTGQAYTIKVVVNGSNHKVYLDDVLYINATDATYGSTSTNDIAIRYYNNTGATSFGTFDNFGVISSVASPMTGTWDNGAGISLGTNIGTVGNSYIAWNSDEPAGTSILIECSLDGGGSWHAATNGDQVPELTYGTPTGGLSVKIRATLTSNYPSITPILKGLSCWLTKQTSASGTRISPQLSLANVGRAGSTYIGWTPLNASLPTNTSVAVAVSPDASTWTDVTAEQDAALPSGYIYTQSLPWVDFFISSITRYSTRVFGGTIPYGTTSSASYTQSSLSGGAAATWTWDGTNNRLLASQTSGVDGILVYPGFIRADMYAEVALNRSDSGGVICRMVDTSHCYLLSIADASASANANTAKLYAWGGGGSILTVPRLFGSTLLLNTGTAGLTLLGSATISFARGDWHIFRLDVQGTVINAYMDKKQIITAFDSSITAAGKAAILAGLHTNDAIQAYYFRVKAYGDNVSGNSIYSKVTLTSTDPTVTPQVQDLILSVRNPDIQSGATIDTTNYAGIGQNMAQASQAFDDLVKQSSVADPLTGNLQQFLWYFDNLLNFKFHQQQAKPAPFYVYSDGASIANGGTGGNILITNPPIVTRNDGLYRNRQTIDGGIDTTTTITYSPPTDGLTQVFTMAYPVNSAPTIIVDEQPQTVGVQGTDTGMQFYYKVGSADITQDAAQEPVAKTSTLTVVYVGQIPVRETLDNTGVENPAATPYPTVSLPGTTTQAQLATIDGTSGIVEDYQSIPNLSKAAATTAARGLLAQYGVLGQTWTFSTNWYGLQPGMCVVANVPEFQIVNTPYVVESVNTKGMKVAQTSTVAPSGILYQYDVKVTTGPILGDWKIMFQRMLQGSTM